MHRQISVLREFVIEIQKVKLFAVGHLEPHIQDGFRLLLFAEVTNTFALHEVEPNPVDSGVQLFFVHSFSEIKEGRHILGDLPTEKQ